MKLIIAKTIILLNFAHILLAQSYRAKFKKNCGKPHPDVRIAGGKDAEIGEFPWMARIALKVNRRKHYFCGGSLITDRHVLTAAHCLERPSQFNMLKKLVVSLGDYYEKHKCAGDNKTYLVPPVRYKVSRVYPNGMIVIVNTDDIAILELAKKVAFTKFISPICLPDNISPAKLIGQSAIVIGFGIINSFTKKLPKILQKVKIEIKEDSECNAIYKPPLAHGQICAGTYDKGSCIGDSGGPLFKLIDDKKDDARFTIFGIVSYGAAICDSDWPGVYTDVNYYLDWIDGHLDN